MSECDREKSILRRPWPTRVCPAMEGGGGHYTCIKVNQSHFRPEVPRGFQEVKVPRLRDNGTEWW